MWVGLSPSAWLMLCLTARLSSLRWRSCWDPRLYRGTVRCLRECAEEGHFQAGTGFPGYREEKTGWLFISVEDGWWTMIRVSLLRMDFFLFKAIETLEAVVVYDGNIRLQQDWKKKTHMQKCTFFGSMLNFFLPIAICLFLCDVLLEHKNIRIRWRLIRCLHFLPLNNTENKG